MCSTIRKRWICASCAPPKVSGRRVSRCEADQLFYVVYGIMNAMNGRYFDVDNYLVTAAEISGPWSEPVYIHSVGYDASVSTTMTVENGSSPSIGRPGMTIAGDLDRGVRSAGETPVGYPRGFGKVYGMAEGRISPDAMVIITSCAPRAALATAHCVTLGRARHILGPYEKIRKARC